MTLTGLLLLSSGFFLMTLASIPTINRRLEIWPESGGSRGSGYTWSQQG